MDNNPSRVAESNVGSFSCDAFLNLTTYAEGKIDFCILNGGGMRASIARVRSRSLCLRLRASG